MTVNLCTHGFDKMIQSLSSREAWMVLGSSGVRGYFQVGERKMTFSSWVPVDGEEGEGWREKGWRRRISQGEGTARVRTGHWELIWITEAM